MEPTTPDKLDQLPDEMFTIIKSTTNALGPRFGRLSLPGRKVMETPHYLALSSRGVVPHITQDTFARDTNIDGVYIPLEDFIERAPYKVPPVYQFSPPDGTSPLRRFIALPEETLMVLGARRTPPVIAPAANPNTNESVQICTSVGFRALKAEDYAEGVETVKADIVVGLGDSPFGRAVGAKRIEKATDRSIEWMQDHAALRTTEATQTAQARVFAPLLPVPCANQQFYIDTLTQDLAKDISGLAVYDTTTLEDLPESLHHHPRLAFTEPNSPHQVLRHISQGIDITTIPFITAATDAGIALDFSFPPQIENKVGADPLPLGLDMWLPTHATNLSPLVAGCKCYTCTGHHRAYLQHLLSAKEMLGWILLQVHNHHTMDTFFAGIRNSIREENFDGDVRRFEEVYQARLPEKTGQGPRVRGYQYKSEGPGEQKKNKAAFTMLDDGKAKLAEATVPSGDTDAEVLEEQGLAEKRS